MQRRAAIVAITALSVSALGACAGAPQPKNSKSSSGYVAGSVNARCTAQEWPQPMPDIKGQAFDPLSKDLMCFNNIEAVAPDGHDVMNDSGSGLGTWTVVSSTPAPGARVRMTTPITIQLRETG
ncbi:hypothetical protein [Streptomyces sp. NPDC127038]|uniref:hypothetical protein n=1 Tax=Streptomyces sp. NPDC127038 TaxID=3347114 RepID=UPI003646B6C0